MSDETTLLPCPFCGSEARMLGTKERWFNPACSNSECGCEWTDSYVTEAEAIAAWNTRATHYKLCTVLDVEYETKMDALLCRLTNGKWSKSRAYDLDFMEACISEEFEALYSKEQFSAPVSGTLTAEQVREAAHGHYKLRMVRDVDGLDVPQVMFDWHGIADELNAVLGSGTCEFSPTTDNPPTCSNCGWQADAYDCDWLDGGTYEYNGRFCKNCGALARKAVER